MRVKPFKLAAPSVARAGRTAIKGVALKTCSHWLKVRPSALARMHKTLNKKTFVPFGTPCCSTASNGVPLPSRISTRSQLASSGSIPLYTYETSNTSSGTVSVLGVRWPRALAPQWKCHAFVSEG